MENYAKRKGIKRGLCIFLAFLIMGLTIFNNNLTLQVVKAQERVSGTHLVEQVTVIKKGVDGAEDTVLESGNCEIKKTDILNIVYNLTDLFPGADDPNKNMEQGKTYIFELPENLKMRSTASWDILVDAEHVLGTCTYDADAHAICLVFEDERFQEDGFTGVYIGFEAQLAEDKLTEEEEQKIVFPLTQPVEFTFTYGDFVPKTDSTISKTGEYNADTKEITWTVRVVEGTKNYTGNMVLQDTLSANQEYVAGSFQEKIGEEGSFQTPATAPVISVSAEGNQVITYEYTPSNVKDTVRIFTYKSKFTQEALMQLAVSDQKLTGGVKTLKAQNEVSLLENNNEIAGTYVEVTAEIGEYKWLEKAYVKKETDPSDSNNAILTWQLTIDTHGYSFKNVKIKDTITCKPTNAGSSQALITDSLKLKKVGESTETALTMSTTSAIANAKGQCTWECVIAELNGIYTLTYQTKIINYTDYRKYNQNPIKNSASAELEWPAYGNLPGNSGNVLIPEITVTAGDELTNTAIIEKKAKCRVFQNNGIFWTITVNRNKMPLDSSYYIVETIGGVKPGNNEIKQMVGAGDSPFYNVTVNGVAATAEQLAQMGIEPIGDGDNTYKITFGNLLNGNMVEFDFFTQYHPDEIEFYQGNNYREVLGRNARNSATLYEGNNELSTVTSTLRVYPWVLKKSFESYDYNTREAVWKVVVNEDRMPLKDVVLEDKLEVGELTKITMETRYRDMTWVRKTEDLSTTPNAEGIYYEYDETTKMLKVYFGDITGHTRYDLFIHTRIGEDEEINDNGTTKTLSSYNGNITISNTAVLKKDGSSPVTVTSEGVIENKVLGKSGMIVEAGEAAYEIIINQAQVDWPEESWIIDIMSPGMVLDLSSVELYEAVIDNAGEFTKAASAVDVSKYEKEMTILEADNEEGEPEGATKLVLKLPQDAGNNAYILRYNAYLEEGTTYTKFTNKVNAIGVENRETQTSTEIEAEDLKGYGGATKISYSKVKIVKENENGTPLQGAEYALLYQGEEIARKVTNENGEIVFSALTPGVTYSVKEITAPTGYELDDTVTGEWSFEAKAKGDTYYLENPHTFTDKYTEFSIQKTNEEGIGLAGAVFGVFPETEEELVTEKALETVVSDADGKVVFQYRTPGNYQIAEITAPEGYAKSSVILMAEIDSSGAVIKIYDKADTAKTALDNPIVQNLPINNNDPAPNPEPTPEPDPEPNPEPTPDPEPETEIKPEDEYTYESEPDPTPEPETGKETDSDTDSTKEPDSETNSKGESDTDTDSKDDSESEPDEDSDTDKKSETKEEPTENTTSDSDTDKKAESNAANSSEKKDIEKDKLPETGKEERMIYWAFGFVFIMAGILMLKKKKI